MATADKGAEEEKGVLYPVEASACIASITANGEVAMSFDHSLLRIIAIVDGFNTAVA